MPQPQDQPTKRRNPPRLSKPLGNENEISFAKSLHFVVFDACSSERKESVKLNLKSDLPRFHFVCRPFIEGPFYFAGFKSLQMAW